MKTVCQLVLILGLAAGPALAQQPGREASATTTNANSFADNSRLLLPLIEITNRSQEVITGKKLELGGSLVRPLKVKKVAEVPKILLQLINPFASSERKIELESTRGVSNRAWSSVVGWNPGGSAFPDVNRHEPSMAFFTLAKASKD